MRELLIGGVAVATTVALAVGVAADGTRSAETTLVRERQALIYQQTCARCHMKPGIGVPLLGDDAAWAPKRAQGFDALVRHTVEGFGDMPPLGTCSACTEDDIRRLVAFVAGYDTLPSSEKESAR
jgi:cytochrome c5